MSADRVRWEHIQRVYELCNRNVSETARRLNMHRRTLQRILEKAKLWDHRQTEPPPEVSDSGAIRLDGATIDYYGLEPITLGGTAADVVVNLTSSDDVATLNDSAGDDYLDAFTSRVATSRLGPKPRNTGHSTSANPGGQPAIR